MGIGRRGRSLIRAVLTVAAIVCVLLGFRSAVSNLDKEQSTQSAVQLEESIRRAAVACYAAEGRYPPDLDYIAAHYGVCIDAERYAVFYEINGENLMPVITVLEYEDEQ